MPNMVPETKSNLKLLDALVGPKRMFCFTRLSSLLPTDGGGKLWGSGFFPTASLFPKASKQKLPFIFCLLLPLLFYCQSPIPFFSLSIPQNKWFAMNRRLAWKSLRLRKNNRKINVQKLEVCARGRNYGWGRKSLFSAFLTGVCL